MRVNLSSAYDVRAENAVHVNPCLCLSFQTRISAVNSGVMRMMSVMGSQCFCSKTSSRLKSGAREWAGEALPYLAYAGQVCAAEQKVLSIKQGVELYYFSSKILIIYFYYFNGKFKFK